MNPRRRHKQKARRKLRGALTPRQYAHKVAADKRVQLKRFWFGSLYGMRGPTMRELLKTAHIYPGKPLNIRPDAPELRGLDSVTFARVRAWVDKLQVGTGVSYDTETTLPKGYHRIRYPVGRYDAGVYYGDYKPAVARGEIKTYYDLEGRWNSSVAGITNRKTSEPKSENS